MKYARVEDNQIIEFRDFADGELPEHKAYLWRVVEEIIPTYNPFYQVSFGPDVVIEEDKVRFVYTVEDKDPLELEYLVKAEAENRILSKYPLWRQNNMIMTKLELLSKSSLTDDERSTLSEINEGFNEIEKIRACSNKLESSVVPEDYRDNKYWEY